MIIGFKSLYENTSFFEPLKRNRNENSISIFMSTGSSVQKLAENAPYLLCA